MRDPKCQTVREPDQQPIHVALNRLVFVPILGSVRSWRSNPCVAGCYPRPMPGVPHRGAFVVAVKRNFVAFVSLQRIVSPHAHLVQLSHHAVERQCLARLLSRKLAVGFCVELQTVPGSAAKHSSEAPSSGLARPSGAAPGHAGSVDCAGSSNWSTACDPCGELSSA